MNFSETVTLGPNTMFEFSIIPSALNSGVAPGDYRPLSESRAVCVPMAVKE